MPSSQQRASEAGPMRFQAGGPAGMPPHGQQCMRRLVRQRSFRRVEVLLDPRLLRRRLQLVAILDDEACVHIARHKRLMRQQQLVVANRRHDPADDHLIKRTLGTRNGLRRGSMGHVKCEWQGVDQSSWIWWILTHFGMPCISPCNSDSDSDDSAHRHTMLHRRRPPVACIACRSIPSKHITEHAAGAG
eukprot:360180-Chlamydomonas_euryale.AAC.8